MATRRPLLPAGIVTRHAALALCLAVSAPLADAQPCSIAAVVTVHPASLAAAAVQGTSRSATEQYANPDDDSRESELKHHLAGWLVVLAGVFLVVEPTLRRRWPAVRYAWPLCFLACGLFLLFFSDTELWPVGRESWWYGVMHDPEDLQHKLFALILLVLGAIELQRAHGGLRSAWAASAFPLLALAGSLMLLLHQHSAAGHDAGHMIAMKHVQAQHVTFAMAGGGIAIAKGLSEVRTQWQGVFLRSWPLLLIGLGVLLIRYAET